MLGMDFATQVLFFVTGSAENPLMHFCPEHTVFGIAPFAAPVIEIFV